MYKSHVVAGRIIEIQEDRILTQQGDVFCTYHSRYYMLPPQEAEPEGRMSMLPEAGEKEPGSTGFLEKSWIPGWMWFPIQKKSANRI